MAWHTNAEIDERRGSIARLKTAFEVQPPTKQRETIERVKRLVAERPQSYLARIAKEVYGI